jgi:hypothetical protein
VARRVAPARAASLAAGGAAALGLLWSGASISHRLPPYHNQTATYFLYDIVHDVAPLLDAAGVAMAPGEPLYVAQYASHPFAFYRHGRFADATVCQEVCDPYRSLQRWLKKLHGRGWILVVDDESALVASVLPRYSATFRQRFAARGVKFWEVKRP